MNKMTLTIGNRNFEDLSLFEQVFFIIFTPVILPFLASIVIIFMAAFIIIICPIVWGLMIYLTIKGIKNGKM